MNDILDEWSMGRPDEMDVPAAVIDCDNPCLITLLVWNTELQDIPVGDSGCPSRTMQ